MLVQELSDRQRDVLARRLEAHETFNDVGKVHGVTRECIRQIETSAVRRLRQMDQARRLADEWGGNGLSSTQQADLDRFGKYLDPGDLKGWSWSAGENTSSPDVL